MVFDGKIIDFFNDMQTLSKGMPISGRAPVSVKRCTADRM